MKKEKVIARFFIASLLMIAVFSCSKKDTQKVQNQVVPVLSPTVQKVNPYDSLFVQYSSDMVNSLFKMASEKIGYEEYMVKVDSLINSSEPPLFSTIVNDLEVLNDNKNKQLHNMFFNNLVNMDVYSSAAIVENILYSYDFNENEENVCLYVLSYMKTIISNVEGTQEFLPGGGYYRYLDCMRERHENMNEVDWLGYVVGWPGSFLWEVFACVWEANHQEH